MAPQRISAAHANAAHADYEAWSAQPPKGVGTVTMSATIALFRDTMDGSEYITNGAGNYASWLHRFLRYRSGMQLAPTSGSMGYGLPAASRPRPCAIAAARCSPLRATAASR